MKKILLFAVLFSGAIAFTSCGGEECECNIGGNTTTYTEDQVEGSLSEYCSAADAASVDGSCSMK